MANPAALKLHAYQKLRAFVTLQTTNVTFFAQGLQREKLLGQLKALHIWKQLSYLQTTIHILLGLAIVTIVTYAFPELIRSPVLLALFGVYIFLYMFLGFLTLLGLYKNSRRCVKISGISFFLIQKIVFFVSYQQICECHTPAVDCPNSSLITTRILLPLLIHSLLYYIILYKYVQSFSSRESHQDQFLTFDTEQKSQRCGNITIIVEEVL